MVETHKQGTLIIVGDSNQIIYPFLDKSPVSTNIPIPSYQWLLHQYSLLDTWREHNPTKRQYTHYSHPHKQFSRIDLLFVMVSTSALIINSHIIPCVWSDHNAVKTTFSSLVSRSNHRTWYINNSLRLLANSSFQQRLETAIKDCLITNNSTDTDPLTHWEAHKPYIRGVCISHTSFYHKEQKQLHKKLEDTFYRNSAIPFYHINPFSCPHLWWLHVGRQQFHRSH